MLRIATICLGVYWCAIFVATHLPKSSLPSLHWSDKTYHAVAFAGLAFLLAWAVPSRSLPKQLAIVALLAATYACLDEFTQRFIPGRTCELGDVFADLVGVALGIVCYVACRHVLSNLSWGRQLIRSLAR